jgi:hypothetical protein
MIDAKFGIEPQRPAVTRRVAIASGIATVAALSWHKGSRQLSFLRGSGLFVVLLDPSGALSPVDADALTRAVFGSAADGRNADPALALQVLRFADAAGWAAPFEIAEDDGFSREDPESRALHGTGRAIDIVAQSDDEVVLRRAARSAAGTGGAGLKLGSGVVHLDTGAPRLWSRQLI